MPQPSSPHDPLGTSLITAVGRGLRRRCPCCGQGILFHGFLSLNSACSACALPLGHFRADDAPPYFVILIVGHLVVFLAFALERAYSPPLWLHAAIWAPVIGTLVYLLLPRIKGAVIAVLWKFQTRDQDPYPDP
ncbi:MAG: DUF983 domain-containing protein [Rhodospirillales bacterium]|nr:DUF983 domain-containing protein [Rhodospirillales bacterium]